uniref:Uncharacterized protein n=1 Tax=viral metagenome TaxID=1070528 RepID=A0A6C0I0M3_9ZZZZ
MNLAFLIYFCVFIELVAGLLPTNNLEGILARKAAVSNIFNNLRSEISTERLFIEFSSIVPYHHHQNNLLSISLLGGTYLFGQFKYNTGEKEQYIKLKKLDRYKKLYNIYRNITFIIVFIFFKDIENVL